MSTPALIGLGSNLGDRKALLDSAVASLSNTPGFSVQAVSSYHETAPVGGPAGQHAFLNAAALIETVRSPWETLAALQEIEALAGRVRSVRWGERTLDLDLLIHGQEFMETPELTVPHPRMAYRRFVIAPASEIAPALVHIPSGQNIAELLATLDRRPSYLALAGPPSDLKRQVFQAILSELPGLALRQDVVIPEFLEDIPADPSEPGWGKRQEKLEAELNSLDSRNWPPEIVGETWLVSDFSHHLDQPNWNGVPLATFWEDKDEDSQGRTTRLRFLSAYSAAIQPTITAVIDPSGTIRPGPWLANGPQLWPDLQSVSSAVSEIFAGCASTRTG